GRRHTRFSRDWSSDVCSSDLPWNIARTPHQDLSYFSSESTSTDQPSAHTLPCGIRSRRSAPDTWLRGTAGPASRLIRCAAPLVPDRKSVVEGKRGGAESRRTQ